MTSEIERLQSRFEQLVSLSSTEQAVALRALRAHEPALATKLAAMIELDARYQPDEDPAALRSGADRWPQLADYELLDRVGSGGMGEVFRAVQRSDAQHVVRAIKLLHGHRCQPQLRERFEAECKVLSELDHPGIARYIASGFSDGGAPYVVMEYIQGEPIDRWCDARCSSLRERIALVRQLLLAVQHAHQRLIVHRDIKPNNVLVDANGKLVLVDFGIAKRLSAERGEATATADRFLSLLSAAPEQLAGRAAGTGTDIYAIGLLLYRLLSGHDPFVDVDDASPLRYQQRVMEQPAPSMAARLAEGDRAIATTRGFDSVHDLRRALRGDLGRIVLRCLRKSPAERYPDAGSLDRDLRAVLEGWPISERESEPMYRLRKFVGRHRLGVALGSAAVLSLCVTVGAALLQRSRALHERDRAEAAVSVLKQAFAAANPLGVSGGDARVSEVLDASRGPLQALRDAQPQLFATLSLTMAEVELSAGRPRQALQRAREALRSLDDSAADGVQQRLQQVEARAQLEAGEFSQLQLRLQALPQRTLADRVERMTLLGRFAYLRSQMDQAVKDLQQADALALGLSIDDPLRFEVRIFHAQALRLNGQAGAAIAMLQDTLDELSQHFPPEHPRVVLTRLRWLDMQRGHADAERLLVEADTLAAGVETAFGARSAPMARLHGMRAELEHAAGRRAESIAGYEAAWQTWAAATDAGHPNTLRALFNLAFRKGRAGHPRDEVEALFLRLFSDARVGSEQNRAILNYWSVSYVEFLADRRQCAAALEQAGARFGRQSSAAFNSASLELLAKVLERLDEDCGCRGSAADPACQAMPALLDLVGAATPATQSDRG